MQEGYLAFPDYGIVVQMNYGRDIVHCSLKNTLHVPNRSRDTLNWSKVHGP